jgi:hypothetical protein
MDAKVLAEKMRRVGTNMRMAGISDESILFNIQERWPDFLENNPEFRDWLAEQPKPPELAAMAPAANMDARHAGELAALLRYFTDDVDSYLSMPTPHGKELLNRHVLRCRSRLLTIDAEFLRATGAYR